MRASVARASGVPRDGRSEQRARTGRDVAAAGAGRRPAACWRGRTRLPASRDRSRERLRALGARRCRAGPAGALACRSPSASASSSTSPPTASRRWWAAAALSLVAAVAAAILAAQPAGRVSRSRSALAAVAAGFADRDAQARVDRASGAAGGRPGTSTSRASSKCARSASAPTASWCAFTASTAPRLDADARARAGVGAQGHGAAGRQPSSSSRRGCRRRSSRCGPAATTSRATSISRASARPASCSAHPHRRSRRCRRGCWLRYAADDRRHARRASTRASARSLPRRPRRDRVGADHRQARRDLDAGERRDVHLEPRPRAVDLRLSHGGGRGRRLLRAAGAVRADAGVRRPLPDQEMGGGRRRSRRRRSICVLSGAEVATQRSFIMIAIVLIGVMVDRPAHHAAHARRSRRIVVLLLAPRGVVHPSFQMSFAATLALVAGYERGLPWMSAARRHAARRAHRAVGRARDRRAHPRVAGRGLRDHALRRLSFPSPGALWRDRQPAGDADRLGLGDADGPPRRARRCRSASTASAGG